MTTDELPNGWAWATVNEVIKLCQYGSSAKTNADASGVPVLRMGNLQGGELDLTELKYLPTDHNEFPTLFLQPGDLLFNRTNSAELVGKSAVYVGTPSPCSYASYLVALRFSPACESKYLSFYLNSHYGRVWVKSVATQQVGQANLNSTKLRALRFPLAPLAEQRRMVEKVEEQFTDLAAGVAALERVRRNLKRYRSAVLHWAVTGRLTAAWRAQHGAPAEPGPQLLQRILTERRKQWEERTLAKYTADERQPPKNWRERYAEPEAPKTEGLPELPEGWCWASGAQLILDFRSGTNAVPVDSTTPIRILRSSAVRPGRLYLNDFRYLPAGTTVAEEDYVRIGDLLFVRLSGSLHLAGACALVEGEVAPGLVFPDRLFAARCVRPPMARLLEIVFQSRLARNRIEPKAKSTAGHQRISMEAVLDQPVPLPPVVEQGAIVEAVQEKLSQIDALEAEVEQGLARAGRLRQAILKAAFEGKLVPQDPNDEPAAVLLERLRSARTTAEADTKAKKPARTKRAKRQPPEGESA